MEKEYNGILALDLDGTLLNSNKELTEENRIALEKAWKAGFAIVPTTGRYFDAMPEAVRRLPFLRYAITVNGAQVLDHETGETLYQAEIPLEETLGILQFLDDLPVIYDCYQDGRGFMTEAMQKRAAEFACDAHYLTMIRTLRQPVPELKAFLRERGSSVQKIQLFTRDLSLRDALPPRIHAQFSHLSITSSVSNNLEINHENANKGQALMALADALGVLKSRTYAFGDGSNDISMLRAAHCGIAMKNAGESVKKAADTVTASCDENGVAKAIDEILQGRM